MQFSGRWFAKAFALGLLNFAPRFAVGGFLWYGAKLNPEGFAYGATLTVTAFLIALCFMKFLMQPRTMSEALIAGILWAGIGLALDAILLGVVFQAVTIPYLFRELQTWTRAAAVVAAAVVAVKRKGTN